MQKERTKEEDKNKHLDAMKSNINFIEVLD